MSDLILSDLPFAEQVADIEALAACNGILAVLGKAPLADRSLDAATRRRFAYAIITGRTADEDTLRQIAAICDDGDHENNTVLCAIARHPAAPLDVVIRLAWNEYLIVSELAACRQKLPVTEIERLAREGPLGARMGIAVNPATPDRVRAALTAKHRGDKALLRARVAAWYSGEWARNHPSPEGPSS
jgi:hypothetical protein